MASGSVQAELNRLANGGADYRTPDQVVAEQGAANEWAGTSGLATVAALNDKAGTSGLDLQGVCNALAGTSGLGAPAALALVVA